MKTQLFFPGVLVYLLVTSAAYAARPAAPDEGGAPLQVSASDQTAADSTTAHRVHTRGALRPEGGQHPSETFEQSPAGPLVRAKSNAAITEPTPQPMPYHGPGITPPGLPAPGFYPDDMYPLTPQGPVVVRAEMHDLYVNNEASHWGNPSAFQRRLLDSTFIHVVDQYVGSTGQDRYEMGRSVHVNYTIPSAPLTDSGDIAAIVHAAAARFGSGYDHIYNVFLPKGVDVCITSTACYSPDNAATWNQCSYHASVDFTDIGHVLYAVIPYQDDFETVGGTSFYLCDVGQANPTANTSPTPNGVLIDSISNAITHETFEVISDPDGNAWLSLSFEAQASFYAPGEIGDICTNLSFLYTPSVVDGKAYYIGPVYSNKYHLCTTKP
jgi:hypothetical protein